MAFHPKGRLFTLIAALPHVCGSAAMSQHLIAALAQYAFEGFFEDAHALIDLFVADGERDENA